MIWIEMEELRLELNYLPARLRIGPFAELAAAERELARLKACPESRHAAFHLERSREARPAPRPMAIERPLAAAA